MDVVISKPRGDSAGFRINLKETHMQEENSVGSGGWLVLMKSSLGLLSFPGDD